MDIPTLSVTLSNVEDAVGVDVGVRVGTEEDVGLTVDIGVGEIDAAGVHDTVGVDVRLEVPVGERELETVLAADIDAALVGDKLGAGEELDVGEGDGFTSAKSMVIVPQTPS